VSERLNGTEDQAHARAVLGSALASGEPSHAYLFHGLAGTGKRTVARAFAAELLAFGSDDPDGVRRRVASGSHPDLTWVVPSGAHEMRVDDVEGPVIGAASRTPFEASKRVFVLERVDTMSDAVANRMLKTLEEPAHYVHLILLTDSLGQVIETVQSRCQLVRFDPLPSSRVAALLEAEGIEPARARACARLSLGNATRARFLASEEGVALRGDVERLVSSALGGRDGADVEPWRPLLARSEKRKAAAEKEAAARAAERLEIEPKGREKKSLEKELEEAGKRSARRAQREVLDLGLGLTALSLRDRLCALEGAGEAVLATDGAGGPAGAVERDPRRLREAIEHVEEARLSLELNVTEDLALEALTSRLRRLVGAV